MLTAFRRDVRMVLDGLRGRSPSPVIARPKSPVYPDVAVDALSRARTVDVIEVRRETRDAVTLALREASGRHIEFVPGQFMTVVATVGGENVRRAYSISRGRDDGGVEITVKRIDGGRVSTWMTESVQVGATLQVLGPSGEFTAEPGTPHLIAVAGGSGITPIMAIARSVIAEGGRVSLLYGNRDDESVIFRDELARMERGGRLAVTHVIGEILDGARIAAWAEAVGGDSFHVCGPEGLMAAARLALDGRGRIKEERFTAPARRQQATVERAQAVTIRRAGVAMDIVVPAGTTLLDAGLAAGVPMKLSCAMGGCGACAVTLTAGEVVMDEPNCLGAAERARGVILACVARPISACTVETA